MIHSMTGFGRGEAQSTTQKFNIEIRSVNHRFCEISVRIPRIFAQLEENIRRTLKKGIARGKVDVYVGIENTGDRDYTVKVDKGLAMAYYRSIKELQTDTGVGGEVKIEHLLSLPGIIEMQENQSDAAELWPFIESAIAAALEQLLFMREAEGAELARDLLLRVDKILGYGEFLQARAPQVVEEYRNRLFERLEDLHKEVPVDSDRVALEVALFADKGDITEEIVRLRSHLVQVRECLAGPSPIGRKLDFLVQEMHREINTIGSKSNDVEIGNVVVELKSELEKIREQVQNIE